MAERTAARCRDCGAKPQRTPRAFYCEDCYLKGDRAYAVQYQERNREKYRERTRLYMAAQRASNPVELNERKQRSLYRLAPGEFDAMRAKQDGRCALCGVHESDLARPLVVDHDHACCDSRQTCGGCNRSLLCGNCNGMLGFARDAPEVLRAAAEYIEKHRHDREHNNA